MPMNPQRPPPVPEQLLEQVGGAWFLKGTVRVRDQVAVRVKFSCALKS